MSWVGDGHYGTFENLVLADQESIKLYAPRAGVPNKYNGSKLAATKQEKEERRKRKFHKFTREDFRRHPERNTLICPADEELRFIGEYPTDNGRETYRLYGRTNCTRCNIKEQCTKGTGRRVKLVGPAGGSRRSDKNYNKRRGKNNDKEKQLSQQEALVLKRYEERMEENGDDMRKLRGHVSESINAHLKQHGLGRFHVWGMGRCAAVQTLACIAHNMMKWLARQTTQRIGLSAEQNLIDFQGPQLTQKPVKTGGDPLFSPNCAQFPLETIVKSGELSTCSAEKPMTQALQ